VSFGLSVAAFDNCPLPDSEYRFFTEKRAVDHFRRIVPLVERGIRPWNDNEVEAAGFEPLVLRAWCAITRLIVSLRKTWPCTVNVRTLTFRR
jgi:hypothetical protein